MPSFGGALTSEQIDAVVGYLRTFCKSDGWPRGELNLPRPLVTEKAFPETESVVTTTVNATGRPGVSNNIVTEQRLSKRNQLEISVPVNFVHPEKGLLVRRCRRHRHRPAVRLTRFSYEQKTHRS